MARFQQALGYCFTQPIAFIDRAKQQPPGIRGDTTPGKISNNLFPKESSKTELFVAHFIYKGVLAKKFFVVSQQHLSRCSYLFKALFMKNPG
jgi:hypothetical protein